VFSGTKPEEFAKALVVLISGGFIQLAEGSKMMSSS
jgi:hypothetical protein